MIRTILFLLSLLVVSPSFAEVREPEIFKNVQGVAIKGYDSVAYHLDRKARMGSAAHSHDWKGATWHFVSAENRDMFAADPERYAPQYGGYCAWAIARGRTAPINPTIFRIFDDKLYLNLNMDVHKRWLKKHSSFIAAANNNWPKVLVLAE